MDDNISLQHIKQFEETACGAATLAMIYQNLGELEQTERIIWERLRVQRPNNPDEYYLETNTMARDSQSLGYSYFIGHAVLRSSEEALQPIKKFISLSIPVVVSQRISDNNEWGHFRIVTKIDNDYIYINDPMDNGPGTMPVNKFMDLWQESKNGEVKGGVFFAIFKKEHVSNTNSFLVNNFESSVESFEVSNLSFI